MDYTRRHAHEFKKSDEYLNTTIIKVKQPFNELRRIIFKCMNQNRLMYLFLRTLEHTPQDLKNYILDMKPKNRYDLIYDTNEGLNGLTSFKFSLVVHRRKKADKLRVKNPLSLLQAKNALELYETVECNLWSYSINEDSTDAEKNIFYETLYSIDLYEDEINDYMEHLDTQTNAQIVG